MSDLVKLMAQNESMRKQLEEIHKLLPMHLKPEEYSLWFQGWQRGVDAMQSMQSKLDEACDRLRDMLKGDDGQAWKEAERFLEKLK